MANYRNTEADVLKSGLFGGPGGGGMKRKRQAKRKANQLDRQRKRDNRDWKQSKIITTGWDTPGTTIQPEFEDQVNVEVGVVGSNVDAEGNEMDPIVNTTTTGEMDASEMTNKEMIEKAKKDNPDLQMNLKDEQLGEHEKVDPAGDSKIRAGRVFQAHKLVDDPSGMTGGVINKKAEMEITNAPRTDYGGNVSEDAGQRTTFRKYDDAGVLKREKEFIIKEDSPRRKEGKVSDDTEGSGRWQKEKKEKGVRYISKKKAIKKQERFTTKWNMRAGYGAAELRPGGATLGQEGGGGTSKDHARHTATYNQMSREEKVAYDKKQGNTFLNKSAQGLEEGDFGIRHRVKNRQDKRDTNRSNREFRKGRRQQRRR